MYYRVYTLKHCEIILLHRYINYYTKYLIGVIVTAFIEFSDQSVIIQDSQNAPEEMAAIQTTISSQLQTSFSQRDLKIS